MDTTAAGRGGATRNGSSSALDDDWCGSSGANPVVGDLSVLANVFPIVETDVGRCDVSQLRADEKKDGLSVSGVVVDLRMGLMVLGGFEGVDGVAGMPGKGPRAGGTNASAYH